MQPLLQGQADWRPEDYQQAVLSAGMVEGGLYVLPLSYAVPTVVTQGRTAQALGPDAPVFQVSRCGEWQNWARERGRPLLWGDLYADDLWPALDRPLADYGTGETAFGDPLVRELFALAEKTTAETQAARSAQDDALVQRITLYPLAEKLDDKTWGRDPFPLHIAPLRSESGGVNATVFTCAAISASCAHPREAAQFLMMLLRDEVQAEADVTINGQPTGKLLEGEFSPVFPLVTQSMALWERDDFFGQTLIGQCMDLAGQVTGARLLSPCQQKSPGQVWQALRDGGDLQEILRQQDAYWARYISE